MADRDSVLQQMRAAGLPDLPPDHPKLDGRFHRFGKKKKAWYHLREVTLRSGRTVITGSFGIWQGDEPNAIKVADDGVSISAEERAEIERRRQEQEAAEQEKRALLAHNAANRAKMQWQAGSADSTSPYMERKQVMQEGVRVAEDGTLLIPMKRYSRAGTVLLGLQKVKPDGTKIFNKGMDKVGAACLLGKLSDETPLLMIGEGYATVGSARLALKQRFPGMVAFDAGNLLSVAQGVRRDFPDLPFLFLADDDWQLHKRLAKWLVKSFIVPAVISIDGVAHPLAGKDFDADDLDAGLRARLEKSAESTVAIATDGKDYRMLDERGDVVTVTAWRRQDAHGVEWIEAHAVAGRVVQTRKFINAGIARAKEAAAVVGKALVVWPHFNDRGANKWTDFNDLHVEESLDTVAGQLSAAVDHLLGVPAEAMPEPAPGAETGQPDLPPYPGEESPAEPPSPPHSESWADSKVAEVAKPTIEVLLEHFALIYGSADVWDGLNRQKIKKSGFIATVGKDLAHKWMQHEKRRTIDPKSLPVLRGGRAIDGGAGGGDRLIEMLDKLTLLYGTETVWDDEKRMVMSLGAVRAAYGGDMVKRWQEDPRRKIIDADNLVFDPTMQLGPPTHINMFNGYPLVPEQNDEKALAVLELLFDLCRGEENYEEIGHWLLKWLAYPLQHPGAKMQTAVLMFGEKQGTGKSLFFEGITRPIYGEYGGTAGQHQLDSTFTAWKSRKTFMVFEEVLSREDRYSHIGTLKHMITGRDMRINPKNLPERVESNHLNSVFLSNESQPIPIELEDRRFLVIEARNKLTEERVNQLRGLMAQGLSSAFYHYLLHYPLGDFNPHTKPIMTEAKRKIIRYGRAGWDAFHEAWKAGDIQAPYCSCLSEDLYEVYERWCDRTHERKLSLTKFSELLAGREVKDRKRVTFGASPKMRTVFLIDNPDYADKDLSKQCQTFRDVAGVKETA